MTYTLAITDRSYSSWSMRIGLLVDRFALPVAYESARLYTDDFQTLLKRFPPARTVPALRLPNGTVVTESMAIAEELASRFPEKALWPADPNLRALARGLTSEMHAGFSNLRSACPMNLRAAYRNVPVSDGVTADLRRLETIWAAARAVSTPSSPWLCGDYSIADAFFAPVAARIAGYGLTVSEDATAYVQAHLSDPVFQAWRKVGLTEGPDQDFYRMDHDPVEWSGLLDS